jgi:hypothetical protein
MWMYVYVRMYVHVYMFVCESDDILSIQATWPWWLIYILMQ